MEQYQSQSESLSLVKDRIGAQDNSLDSVLITFLETSKSLGGIYRPFYVAALQLEQSLQYQQLKEADNVVFTNYIRNIYSLYRLQSAVDQSYNLDVPAGFEAEAQLPEDQQYTNTKKKTKASKSSNFRSRSTRTNVQF